MIIFLSLDSILSCVSYSTHVNNFTSNFDSLQGGTAAMERMVPQVHQDYQATPDCLVLGLLEKLGLLVRTVHPANLGQKVLNFDNFSFFNSEKLSINWFGTFSGRILQPCISDLSQEMLLSRALTGRFQALLVPKERVINNLILDFLSLQDGTAAMDYRENQEYQETPEYLVLGPLGKLGLLVRKVHLANLGQKVFYSN